MDDDLIVFIIADDPEPPRVIDLMAERAGRGFVTAVLHMCYASPEALEN